MSLPRSDSSISQSSYSPSSDCSSSSSRRKRTLTSSRRLSMIMSEPGSEEEWTMLEKPVALTVRVTKRRTFSNVHNLAHSSKILERVEQFRKLSRGYSIGSSSEGDVKYLAYLRGCAAVERRDNLMIPSSPVHCRPESKEMSEMSVFDSSVSSPSNRERGESNLTPNTQVTFSFMENKSETTENAELNQCQISEYQLGFSIAQLKTSLPIPPGSIFLQDTEHSYVPKLMIKEKKKKEKKETQFPIQLTSEEDEQELLSKLNGMSDKFDDKSGSRLSMNQRKTSKAKPSSEILEPDCIGLLVRSYFEERIDIKDKKYISKFVFSSSPPSIQNHQLKAFTLFCDFLTNNQNKSKKQEKFAEQILNKQQERFRQLTQRKDLLLGQSPPLVKMYSYLLQFECSAEQPCKVGQKVDDTLIIKNKSKVPINFTIYEPTQSPYYTISVSNKKQEVKKNSQFEISISFTLHKPCRKVQELLILEVEGGARYYIGLVVDCEFKQFGVDPLDVEIEQYEGYGSLPKVLIHMRGLLEKYNAFEVEGLFRLAGNDKRIQSIKAELNRGEYIDHGQTVINEIANLIKIWFREIPENLFNTVSPSTLESLDPEAGEHLTLLTDLTEYRKNLLYWLLDLICDVEALKDVNKMTDTNLAIVFSPNLYNRTPKNPMASMIIASKMSGIVRAFIKTRKQQREEQEQQKLASQQNATQSNNYQQPDVNQ